MAVSSSTSSGAWPSETCKTCSGANAPVYLPLKIVKIVTFMGDKNVDMLS